jgi:chromosomal replication initiation ATPase DnaA
MKLKLLAEAASSFYGVPYKKLTTSSRSGNGKGRGPSALTVSPIKIRHICQWVAKDAGYTESVIGRFWGRDPSAVNYGCSKISYMIESDAKEKKDLKLFLAHLRKHLEGRKPHV